MEAEVGRPLNTTETHLSDQGREANELESKGALARPPADPPADPPAHPPAHPSGPPARQPSQGQATGLVNQSPTPTHQRNPLTTKLFDDHSDESDDNASA